MNRFLFLLILLFPLALGAADARAAVYTGAATDPEGDAPHAKVDIVSAAWSFDDAAGRAGISVTLKDVPDAENWGVINASFRTACEGGSEFATIRVSALSSSQGAASAGNADDGVQPDGSRGPSATTATNSKSDDGRTTSSEATHDRLVGRRPGCVRISVTRNGVLDSVTIPVKETQGEPTPPPPPSGETGNPGGPANPNAPTAKPEDVRLGSGRRLAFRRGKASAGLFGVAKGMKIRLSLRLPDGTTIAGVLFEPRVTQPALVTMRLTAKGKRYLRTHRSGKARLLVRTTLGDTFQRRYAVRFVRKS